VTGPRTRLYSRNTVTTIRGSLKFRSLLQNIVTGIEAVIPILRRNTGLISRNNFYDS